VIQAFVALGSNLGDSLQTLRSARAAMSNIPQTRVVACSAVYRSGAIGPGNQPDYLNAVVALETAQPADFLLRALFRIEDGAGRVRHERWEARTLDLDLLLYGDETHHGAELTIPHPRMFERNFVLMPLADLCPGSYCFPDGSSLAQRLRDCPPNPIERTAINWERAASGDGGA
jgi:2-amino-4-hydroxy-6-hydroxymethyldihydropteridine diphosphokinase